MSDYPKIIDGRTVWACCESSIGPVCEHRTIGRRVTPDTLNEIMEFRSRDPRARRWHRDRRRGYLRPGNCTRAMTERSTFLRRDGPY
jgi:hypothetical protein